jgi:glycosyltransferase involved in cell wall biosynthesis
MHPQISVVIPVKNVEDEIIPCLTAIFNQTIQSIEVLVIDGHSTDKTIENAKKFPVKILFEEFGTPAGARQVGLVNAKGDYIAFTDSDCIPYTDWLENLLKEFRDNVVGVGGGTIYHSEELWKRSIYFALNTFLGSATSVQDRVFKNKRVVKSISGCNSMYKKQILLKIAGFNTELEKQIGRISEDAEINNRIQKLGVLIYTPDALVIHNHDNNLKEFAQRMFYWGYVRVNNKLFDIQIVPPIIATITLISIILSIQFFLTMIIIYILLILFFTLRIFFQQRDIKLLFTIPIVYIVEHIAYTCGFWRGILNFILPKRIMA